MLMVPNSNRLVHPMLFNKSPDLAHFLVHIIDKVEIVQLG